MSARFNERTPPDNYDSAEHGPGTQGVQAAPASVTSRVMVIVRSPWILVYSTTISEQELKVSLALPQT